MSTEQRGQDHAVVRRPVAGWRRTTRAGIGGLAAAAVVTLAACGQPVASPTQGATADSSPTSPSASAPSPQSSASPNTPVTTAPATGATTSNPTTTAPATSKPTATKPTSKPTTQPVAGTCAALTDDLTLNQQIGQLFMVATSSYGMTDAEAHEFSELDVGSVLLLQNSTAGTAAMSSVTSSIKDRVKIHHGIKLVLAADQEGGLVQRLAGPGFDTIPSAFDQADLSDDQLRSDAKQWGEQLKQVGINVNLAPDADVVPTAIGTANAPIGALYRGYGPTPSVVARKDTAFITGMESSGIATTVKHFPGLGVVLGNTDTDANVVDDATTRHSKRLAGFRAGINSGVDMVMVSSAVYAKIDADHPATFSTTVQQGMIRHDLGFKGVIISDDLLGEALSATAIHERALRFIKAGGDLAIVGQSADAPSMVDTVRHAAAHNPSLRSTIQEAADRVLVMKARHGLADCTGS